MTQYETCRVFLVDDHPFILSGVQSLLDGQPDITVIGGASDAESAFLAIETLQPDLVIVDGTLPGTSGIALVERLHLMWPGILTLALTLHEEGPYVRQFLNAGAHGFVLKRSAAEDLLRAIRSVKQGGTYIDPAVASKIVASARTSQSHVEALSEREESVMRLVAEGFSNKEICRRLLISVKTVETYRARAYEKLGFRTRAALVRHALSEGWLANG